MPRGESNRQENENHFAVLNHAHDDHRDGVTDDTAAIQLAISSGNRCAPGKCQSSTISMSYQIQLLASYIC